MRRGAWPLAAAVVVVLAAAGAALGSTGTPTFDRGLPTANLNNAAGASRSNVAWSNGNDFVSGDDFTIGSAGQKWIVTGIRTWNITHKGVAFGDVFSDDTLYFGTGAIAPVATGKPIAGSSTDSNPDITHTPVTYADGSDYQGSSGTMLQLWQNDFTHLDLPVDGGQTYYFAVDGTTSSYAWFNHASNAGLAGSPQDGADGHWVAWAKSDLSTPNLCDSGAPTGGVCDGGWDKSSDIDVQVFASQVATDTSQCKDGGWQTLVRADGTAFRNQGDCVSYVEHASGHGQGGGKGHGGNGHEGHGNQHGGDQHGDYSHGGNQHGGDHHGDGGGHGPRRGDA